MILTACSNENMAQQQAYYNHNGEEVGDNGEGQFGGNAYGKGYSGNTYGQQTSNSSSNQQQMHTQQTPKNFVRISDPKENAFSVMMPKGWQAQVSLERPHDQVRPCGMATSPDGASRIFFGDPQIPTFVLPNSSYVQLAQMNPMFRVMPKMDAKGFAQDYIQKVYGQQSQPQISQIRGDQEIYQIMAERGRKLGVQGNLDVAVANFSFNYQGQSVKGELYSIVIQVQDLWIGDVVGLTTTDNPAKISPLLHTMFRSYETNPQWTQQQKIKQQQAMAQSQANHQQRMQMRQQSFNAHQQRMKSNQQAFDASTQVWRQQQNMNDQSHQNWMNQQNAGDQGQQQFLNYIRDENTVTNGGYEGQVQSGYNYYWVDQNGQYIGTNINENPDPSKYTLWKKKN